MADPYSQMRGGGGSVGHVVHGPQPQPGAAKRVPGTVAAAEQFTPGAATAFINNMSTAIGQAPITPRQNFFSMLENWETTLPLTSLWMVFFKVPQFITDEQLKAHGERPGGLDWGVNKTKASFGGGNFTGTYGCALAQTVGIPVEQLGIDTVGPVNRGFLKGPVIQQRQSFAALNIEFLETTLSFNDFVLRPWIILASHLGLVYRQPERSITTDFYVVNLTRAGTDFGDNPRRLAVNDPENQGQNQRSFVPRKVWLFQDCVPVNIGQETYTYGQSEIDRRDTEWNFRRYQVIAPESLHAAFNGPQLENSPLIKPVPPPPTGVRSDPGRGPGGAGGTSILDPEGTGNFPRLPGLE